MGSCYSLGKRVKVIEHNGEYMRISVPDALKHAIGIEPGDTLEISEVDRDEKSFTAELVDD